MKYIFIFLFIGLLSLMQAKCQDVEFKKKNFSDSNGFDQAISNIKKGDGFFAKNKKWLYQQALECYLKANEFNPNNAILNFKIGICYFPTGPIQLNINFIL